MITGEYHPAIVTCTNLRDYFDAHVQAGRGNFASVFDRRGLSYLVYPQYLTREIGVCLPPIENTYNTQEGIVYLGSTF